MFISMLVFQLSGALLLLLNCIKSGKKSVIGNCFPGSNVVERDENNNCKIPKEKLQESAHKIYLNIVAFVDLVIGYLFAVFSPTADVQIELVLVKVEVVLAGKEKKDRILGEEEKKIVAYHEIGHALVATNLKHAEPVQKITIVPRTMGALGYVMQVPEEEKYLMKKEELISEIVTLMGGRAAEQVKFDDITTGASNDIEKATSIARSMVTQYGMSSKFGMMGLETIQSRYLDGRPVLNCGEVTESQIDEEVMAILNDSYKKAVECIETNQTVMDKLAEHLIEKETITGKEFVAIYEEITGEKLKRSGEEKQKEEVKELPQNEEE